ncbi:MAG: tetratricopeptide repeat protein [Armatimonadota bacterium]|nr:tetratricopeptide repeat protein [Armatimonadota bacterium]MCX7777739.1 tetratricopeptide repeat protein [Armatimonadota bacterium]MDW8026206.1 tetratricopeptide repeat protein [Armatimonadota bacterium]
MSADDRLDANNEWYTMIAEARRQLEELKNSLSISEFLYGYYELILNYIDGLAPYGIKWLKAFQAMLQYEAWRHKAMRSVKESSNMNLILVLGIEMRNALVKLLRQLERIYPQNSFEVITLQLLRAECLYQLGHTGEVIEALDKAIEAGCDHPLVYFALGFNIYRQALQDYVEVEPTTQRAIITDRKAFEGLCERAIGAFRSGISAAGTEPMDAQLHFWIGIVYETLGRHSEAKREYERTIEIAPELSKEVEQRLKHIQRAEIQSGRHTEVTQTERPTEPQEISKLERLGRITDEEVSKMGDLLGKIDTLSEFLKSSEGTGEN